MAKRPGFWAYGCAIGLIGAGVAASSACQNNTQFVDEGIPFSEMPEEMAQATCAWVEGCWTSARLDLRDQCLARVTPNVVNAVGPAIAAGIDDGRIVYDAQNAQSCLDATASCSRDQQQPPACLDTFAGQVPVGGDCLNSFDCAGGVACIADAVCPGTCTAWGGAGVACRSSYDCDRNLRCLGGVCTATGSENAPCTSDNDCNYALLCLSVEGAGKCVDPGAYLTGKAGEACGTFATGIPGAPLCEIELVCVQDGPDATTGTCAERVAAGAACSLAFLSQCPPGYYCTGTPGLCEVLPTSGACADLYRDAICQAGYACESGECVFQEKNGVDCTTAQMCASYTCMGGKCGPLFVCDPDE